MKQSLSLDQSVFTSRLAFETVMRSAGIGAEVRKELEKRSVYPLSWEAPSPLIFRSFPLSSAPGDFAVVRARYVDADSSGRRGNFITHSYVVPKRDVDRVQGNLPWLSTHLGCAASVPAGVPADLQRAEVDCDPSRAFRFLRFVIPELSRERAGQLLSCLLAHLSRSPDTSGEADQGLLLNLGPPAAGEHFEKCLAMVTRSDGQPLRPPSFDVLNAWRVAALFSLLPQPFTARASLSINEVAMVPGYALVFQRGGQPTALPALPLSSYVERCLDWVDEDRCEELETLVAWLSEVMVHPSVGVLDDLVGFYDDVITPLRAGTPPPWPQTAERWRRLRSHPPLGSAPLVAAAKACLETAATWHDRQEVVLTICQLAGGSSGSSDSPAGAVDSEILEAAAGLLRSDIPLAVRLAFQRQLPPAVEERLWHRERATGAAAARIGANGPDEEVWLLLSLANSVYPRQARYDQSSTADWILDALERAARHRELVGPETAKNALVILAKTPVVLGDALREHLVRRIHSRLLRPAPPTPTFFGIRPTDNPTEVDDSIARQVLARLLADTLADASFPEACVNQAIEVLVDFVRASTREGTSRHLLLARVMLAWPPPATVDRARRCVRRVAREVRTESAQLAAEADAELLDVSRRGGPGIGLLAPPAHERWVRQRSESAGWQVRILRGPARDPAVAFNRACEALFYENVRRAIAGMHPACGVALGVSYAQAAVPAEDLVAALTSLVRTHRDPISEAWGTRSSWTDSLSFAFTGVLAHLLIHADRLGTAWLDGALRAVADLPLYFSPLHHADLARALGWRGFSLEKMERSAGLRHTGAGTMGGRP